MTCIGAIYEKLGRMVNNTYLDIILGFIEIHFITISHGKCKKQVKITEIDSTKNLNCH